MTVKYKKTSDQVFTYEAIAVTCNKCGVSCPNPGTLGNAPFIFSHSFQVHGSFGFRFPQDGTTIAFELCEPCTKEFVESFQVEPDTARSRHLRGKPIRYLPNKTYPEDETI